MIVAGTKAKAMIFIDGQQLLSWNEKKGIIVHGIRLHAVLAKIGTRQAVDRNTVLCWSEWKQEGDVTAYQKQQKFLHQLKNFENVSYFLGRLERRQMNSSGKKTEGMAGRLAKAS